MKYTQFIVASAIMLSLSVQASTYAQDKTTANTLRVAENNVNAPSTPEQNKIKGQQFLQTNKQKNGVVTLSDGLQYKVLTNGNGAKPTESDVVTVNYEGKLIDGTIFDSSYQRNQPATFPLSGVIPGWVEALKLMPVGSTWELYIPAELAYGETGAPPVIGPNEVLIFKVNLLDIKKS